MTKNIILLHGWTHSKERLFPLKQELEKNNFKVFLPTLPGFAKEKIKEPWNLNNYTTWLNNFLKENDIKRTILIGHSFGGQIATKFALLYPTKISHLVLISAAVIRRPPSLLRRTLISISQKLRSIFEMCPFIYKPLRFLLYNLIKEKDYLRATPLMRETMSKILSENLESTLSEVGIATLILWGREDKTTFSQNAYLIKEKMSHAKMVIFKGATHALPYNKPRQVAKEIIKFLT